MHVSVLFWTLSLFLSILNVFSNIKQPKTSCHIIHKPKEHNFSKNMFLIKINIQTHNSKSQFAIRKWSRGRSDVFTFQKSFFAHSMLKCVIQHSSVAPLVVKSVLDSLFVQNVAQHTRSSTMRSIFLFCFLIFLQCGCKQS